MPNLRQRLTALIQFFSMGNTLSPALANWVEVKIPGEKQADITRRLLCSQRRCKDNKLLNPLWIAAEIDLAFSDLNPGLRKEITGILIFELQPLDLQNYN